MEPAQIADLIIGICFLIFIAVGYHRGLIKTIASIVAMVASYVGAIMIATFGKKPLAEAVVIPMFEKHLSTSGAIAQLAGDTLMKTATGMAYSLLFGISFFILQFVLFRIVRALKAIDDIPVVGKLNKLGGAVLGFLWVFLLCLLLGNIFFTYVPKELRKQWGFSRKAVHKTILLDAFMPGNGK